METIYLDSRNLWEWQQKAKVNVMAWDFSLIPVTVMLWLQFKPTINPFLRAVIFLGP
jgi:hypothetical protein